MNNYNHVKLTKLSLRPFSTERMLVSTCLNSIYRTYIINLQTPQVLTKLR